MMKTSVMITFLFVVSVSVFSQIQTIKVKKEGERTSTKAQLSEVRFIHELVSEVQENDSLVVWDMLCHCNGKVVSAQDRGDKLSEKGKDVLKNADAGTKIYIDVKYSDPKKSSKRLTNKSFSIKVVR